MTGLLDGRSAIIYGGGGMIGSGVAQEAAQVAADPESERVEAIKDVLVGISMLRRRPTIGDVAETAAFLASDKGAGITASIVNVTSGISAL